jgi:hypothetical protein
MKFELSHDKRNIGDGDLIKDLMRVSGLLGKKNLTEMDYKESGKYGVTTIIRRFGSWSAATKRAGLRKSRASNITKADLFQNLEHVWIMLGKQPTYGQMQQPRSAFHAKSHERKFGSWRKALEEFAEFENASEVDEPKSKLSISNPIKKRSGRSVNLRLRFRVMRRDCFKCRICGASPADDQRVVLVVDHIIPWANGGETVEDNLQTLCSKCNQGKSNFPQRDR